ncbi:MAG: hypothetical protein PSV46_16745 [Reyranella sp.]|nr:hypothetical protein [Reyranella sp.]
MCELATFMTAAASAASKVISATQQLQQAEAQRNNDNWLAMRQRTAASADEQRAQFAERQGEADVDAARQKTAQRLGTAQARLAAQGTDLLGSPLDVLGDLAASGAEDALSLSYHAMRNAWEHRVRGAARQAEARRYGTEAGNVDPTLGIARSLLSS